MRQMSRKERVGPEDEKLGQEGGTGEGVHQRGPEGICFGPHDRRGDYLVRFEEEEVLAAKNKAQEIYLGIGDGGYGQNGGEVSLTDGAGGTDYYLALARSADGGLAG